MTLKVLMFGWEFPPYKSGGLGTACYGLTKGMSKLNVETTFVMPCAPEGATADFVKLVSTANVNKKIKIKKITSPLKAYMTSTTYNETYHMHYKTDKKEVYGHNLYEEVQRYAELGKHFAKEPHDVIHAHDWMTYQAAINAKKISGKPLIAHLHATEFDRTGDNPDQRISHIEWKGLSKADRVITNSEFSKKNIIKHYNINPEKIDVVHWGIDDISMEKYELPPKHEKIVLFLGRITIQKGPDYFIEVAKKVLEHEPNTRFVIVGSGDMMPKMIDRAVELDIINKVTFTGALKGDDVHKAFQTADVYVMPSVSEPFGLVALESLKNGTPALISNQSGASEVLLNVLKTDFWDIDEMTNKIVNVLRHDALQQELAKHGLKEVQKFTLEEPARKIKEIFEKMRRSK